MSVTIDQIKEIAEHEGFTPTGFWDYCQDIARFPDKHIASIQAELFLRHPGVILADITRKLAREAEGCIEREPVVTWHGFPLDSVIRWMGSEGWTGDEVWQVIDDQCFDIGRSSVMILLDQGEEGHKIPSIPEGTVRWFYSLLETIMENKQ